MLELSSLDQVRGNSVVLYSIKTLLRANNFPKFSIMSGREGVGKSSVASLVAAELAAEENDVKSINFGLDVDMEELRQTVFSLEPIKPKVYIFEELHGLNSARQTALLNMVDTQPRNVYIIATTTALYRLSWPLKSRATVWEFRALDNNQLAELLDAYLEEVGKALQPEVKNILIRSCHGVPRDLLKNADFATSATFSADDIGTLLGQVPDDTMYAIFAALLGDDAAVATVVQTLLEQTGQNKLWQLRDYWTRFLLESMAGVYHSMDSKQGRTLASMYSQKRKEIVTSALLRAKEETLLLELLAAHMSLVSLTVKEARGLQTHAAQTNEAQKTMARANAMALEKANHGAAGSPAWWQDIKVGSK